MSKLPVIAHHLIWTVYGTWLPNDPRGSGSREVTSNVLRDLGELHYGRKRIQPPRSAVREFYDAATPRLRHDVVTLDGKAIIATGRGLSAAITAQRYTCYACAIMPDHLHLVVRKHKHQAEEIIENLKSSTRNRLLADGCYAQTHPVWTDGCGWRGISESP